ncbi:MAG: tRNA pseudouridine(55) synthase TruB [Armatimonadetes bacterium]|nr:tRNA pseudouridine(55) synthase TruB [Armatimonadota bacterium]
MLGALLIDKPKGITSHDVIRVLRKKFDTRRIGHSGTLDPLATGLLVVMVGPATRLLQYLQLEPKGYEYTVRFGQETDTQDSEGEVIQERPVPSDLGAAIEGAMPPFIGRIQQTPPMFSAVKKDGRPLYAYARAGEVVDRPAREVVIHELDLTSVDAPHATFRTVCEGGTYVRTLANDLGEAIGCGAHVTELRRTRVGRFSAEDAVPLDDVTPNDLLPVEDALDPMEKIQVSTDQESALRCGQSVPISDRPDGELVAMLDESGNLICIARIRDNEAHPECVMPKENGDGDV